MDNKSDLKKYLSEGKTLLALQLMEGRGLDVTKEYNIYLKWKVIEHDVKEGIRRLDYTELKERKEDKSLMMSSLLLKIQELAF